MKRSTRKKFKVGDIVELEVEDLELPKGIIGVVTDINKLQGYLEIAWEPNNDKHIMTSILPMRDFRKLPDEEAALLKLKG